MDIVIILFFVSQAQQGHSFLAVSVFTIDRSIVQFKTSNDCVLCVFSFDETTGCSIKVKLEDYNIIIYCINRSFAMNCRFSEESTIK